MISLFLVLFLIYYQSSVIVNAVLVPSQKLDSHVMTRGIHVHEEKLNCTKITQLFFNHSTTCTNRGTLFHNITSYVHTAPVNVTMDTYRHLDRALTEYCASECKNLTAAFYRCINFTKGITYINNGVCERINQEYCMVRYLCGITSGVIIPLDTLFYCPTYTSNVSINVYCIDGPCRDNVTTFVDYMGCCGVPILGFTFNLTSCGITDSNVCSIITVSPTITVSSTVVISTSPTVAVSSSQVVDLERFVFILMLITVIKIIVIDLI